MIRRPSASSAGAGACAWSLVPMSGTAAAVPLSQLLVKRIDRAYVAAGGLLVAAGGYALLAPVQAHSPLWAVLLGASIYAGGAVGAMTVGNELILGAVPPGRAGVAAAVVETSSELGGALGMAVLGSIGIAVYRADLAHTAPAGLPHPALAAARNTLGGALGVAGQLPARLGIELAAGRADRILARPGHRGGRGVHRHGRGRHAERPVLSRPRGPARVRGSRALAWVTCGRRGWRAGARRGPR